MKKVIVYTTPNCMQCKTLQKTLDRRGVIFDTINLEQHPEMMEQLQELGFSQAPIVSMDGFSFSGYRPAKIDELVRRVNRT